MSSVTSPMVRCMHLAFAVLAMFCVAPGTPADPATAPAIEAGTPPPAEYVWRRQEVMARLSDGILLVHARATGFNTDQVLSHGFHQDPTFYYFTGLENAVSAILAIDGKKRETRLFVPMKLSGLAEVLTTPFIEPGKETATRLGMDHVVDWLEFVPYIDARLEEDPSLVLYVENMPLSVVAQPPPESNPPGLRPMEDALTLWMHTLRERWPQATVKSASDVTIEMHLVKSAREIDLMRRVAKVSAEALLSGMRSIQPGRTQRIVEVEVVRQCVLAGGEGPSFWPLIGAGPQSKYPDVLEALADYRRRNRVLRDGDLVHLDVGCEVELYGGDVGRTVPVSGKFTAAQREVWDLLVAAYHAGVSVMRAGVHRRDVYAASLAEVRKLRDEMRTPLGKRAVEMLLSESGTESWYFHSAGLGPATSGPEVLRAGMIVVFEPYLTLEDQGYYLEDMILIREEGHELLTAGLPYTASEIERAMRR